MTESISMYVWFVAFTVFATIASVVISYGISNIKQPIAARIGVGLGGASVGTLGGALLAASFEVQGWLQIVIIAAVGIACSVSLQRGLFSWFVASRPPTTRSSRQ